MNGLLLVDKQPDLTSHDVVALFRRASKIKKVGHTGTLDPLATGLLLLCVERATRLQSFLMNLEKTYEGEIQFGWATDTYDSAGRAEGELNEVNVEEVDLSTVAEQFRGEIDQVPPAYSAKKVDGVRAYQLARRGDSVQLESKRVRVTELSILEVRGSVARFRVRCSAGTYVRSIAHDLGQALGIGAHLKSLRRTSIGDFSVANAITSTAVLETRREEAGQLFAPPHFIPMNQIPLPLQSVLIDSMQERKLLQGQTVVVKPQIETIRRNDLVSVSNLQDELVAIAEAVEVMREGGGPVALQPKVVLKES